MSSMEKNDRLEAFKILKRVFNQKGSLDLLSSGPQEHSSLTKAICFGVCRYYFRIACIANALIEKRPKDGDIWLLVLMGLYQLQYLQKAEHASIHETVALAAILKKTWAKGLINAVLRRFCREREALLAKLETNEAYVFNHPNWFIERLKTDWPSDWQSILKENDAHPPMNLRVNQKQTTREAYLQELQNKGLDAKPLAFLPEGLLLVSPCAIHELPGFKEGHLSIQDGAAQLAAPLLSLKPQLRVLDLCAAPGGKTCHILETEPGLAQCLALDIDANRIQRVAQNLQRLHLQAKIQVADALDTASWWDGQLFDRILIDAPCSATGVIRRHPDIKLLRENTDIQSLLTVQKELLIKIWPLLNTGGMMLYATCSVLKAENEAQIAAFLQEQKDAALGPMTLPWGRDTGFGWQLFPGENHCDGFFYSVLIRK